MDIFASVCWYYCFSFLPPLLRSGDGGDGNAAPVVVVVENKVEDNVTTPAAISVSVVL
jgi:hypothetical protein